VRIFESGSKFLLGETGNKKAKYVETAKGTNLFFAVFEIKEGKRNYDTIPLNEVIERQKQGFNPVSELDEKGNKLLFTLSPNDLVYVASEEEKEDIKGFNTQNLGKDQIKNIYKVVSFTGNRLYCLPYPVATPIVNKSEFTQLNKIEFIKEKEYCIKLKTDRLGNLSKL
jgi:CRISPR-associated endonuclease Csn1